MYASWAEAVADLVATAHEPLSLTNQATLLPAHALTALHSQAAHTQAASVQPVTPFM